MSFTLAGSATKYDRSRGGGPPPRARQARLAVSGGDPAQAWKPEPVVVGETALGRFKLLERIGAGGFGTVYRGLDERLERAVAVKVIESPGATRGRVLREAQAAARLNHPAIVTLYELGESGGRAYLVSELVEGETVDRLAAAGWLTDREVAELGADLCAALAHAHSHGIVHRDIKPQNVIVRDLDTPLPPGAPGAKLMDFGTAYLIDGPTLTATGEVIGTIAYMAPEQAEGGPVGTAADIYALALTLYECWGGTNPFARRTPAATARAIGRPAPALSEARPDLPPELCGTIDRCLAPEPELRPRIEELEQTLEWSVRRLSGSRPVPATSASEASPRGLPAAPSQRAVAVARIGLLAAAATAVAWLALVGDRPGTALLLALLALPPLLLLRSPYQWAMPAAASLLGAAGIAPVYPALAALAASARERVILALLGCLWLVAAEAILGLQLLLGSAGPAPGWSGSAGSVASGLVAELLSPQVALLAGAWAAAAAVLGAVLRGRLVALELLAVLVWAAAVVALHDAISRGDPEAQAGPVAVAALIAIGMAALWARTTRPERVGDGGQPASLP